MRTRALDGLLTAGVFVVFSGLCDAHGGIYRGPGDVVPPAPGGGGGGGGSGDPAGPTTGEPANPSAPSPSGPTTGGGTNPTTGGGGGGGGSRSPTTGARGVQLDPDLTEWKFWWEFNKDSYIRLKDKVYEGTETGSDDFYLGNRRQSSRNALKPTAEDVQNEILPALKKAIDSTENRDITSSCMVAMAKIGSNHPDFRLIDVFQPRLREPDQAIGIAAIAGEDEVNLLIDLALDRPKARDAAGRPIDFRTRSFATYGLGLLAHETSKTTIKAQAFAVMQQLLTDDKASDRNIKVAAINAIGILDIGSSTEPDRQLLGEALQCLETYYGKSLGAGEQLIQAHCPTAIAKLIGRDHDRSGHFKQLFAADLQGKGKVKRSANDIFRSCAMALGMLTLPYDDSNEKLCPDAAYSKLLLDTYRGHKDAQTRNFAVLALGQIGGDRNREILLKAFDKGNNLEQPWCALALGIYSFWQHEQQPTVAPNRLIGETLTDALEQSKDPSVTGALAIALGLARTKDAADLMRNRMVHDKEKEEMAGYLCIGLALMEDRLSTEAIHGIVQTSVRRDTLLRQAATALGKLGDKQVAGDLLKLLEAQGENNLAKLASISTALAFIGDRSTIRPLTKMLFDSRLGDLSRAFAAVALGGVADKESLPWSAKLSRDLNYRAAVETLTNESAGILDIL
jgi:HEAT repeat protein